MKKIFFIICSLLLLTSCTTSEKMGETNTGQVITSTGNTSQIEEKETIFTSFYPLYFLTKGLVSDTYTVQNLVPIGGEPHEYEPTPKQIEEMISSYFVVMNGLGMEHYEEKLSGELQKNNTQFTHLSENLKNTIQLGEEEKNDLHKDEHHEDEHKDEAAHNHGSIDPHTWLSPKNMIELASLLASELKISETETAKIFITKLKALDTKFSDTLKLCKRKELVTSHEAFAYLARDYGLVQVPVSGIEPDMEPSAADIARVIEVIKDKKITTIFTEPLVSAKFTDTIARETGVKSTELHPLETLTPDEEKAGKDYISIMEENLLKIAEGLDCK